MSNKLITFFFLILILGCSTPNDVTFSVDTLLKVDQEFSDYSKNNGMKKAFLHYADNQGVLLRPNRMPITNIPEFLEDVDDSAFSLIWEPLDGEISNSGDMGFTYGIYTFSQDTLVQKGTYVSIWVKRKGEWKYALDTGNPGIGD